jgi:hypothetical protein
MASDPFVVTIQALTGIKHSAVSSVEQEFFGLDGLLTGLLDGDAGKT